MNEIMAEDCESMMKAGWRGGGAGKPDRGWFDSGKLRSDDGQRDREDSTLARFAGCLNRAAMRFNR